MGERPDQIERHIRNQRDELSDNINELEQKVKETFDWRSQFEAHPGAMLGAAFAGGMLLAAILPSTSTITSRVNARRRSFKEPYSSYTNVGESSASSGIGTEASSDRYRSESRRYSNYGEPRRSETWDNLKNAVIGLAATRLGEYIEEFVPGFRDHYQKAAAENRQSYQSQSFSSAPPYHATPEEKSWQKPNGGTDHGSHS